MDASGRIAGPATDFGALGRWWRYERYEVRDGFVRPAPGARGAPYDPWTDYLAARSGWGGGGGKAPYESLLELTWSFRLLPPRGGERARLAPESEVAVATWCGEHGLLGLLPHQYEVAFLAPRWGEAAPGLASVAGPVVPVRRSYTWEATGWQPDDEQWWRTKTPALEQEPKQVGQLVPEELWPEHWGRPTALGRSFGRGAWGMLPLGSAWGRYFPNVPSPDRDTWTYPQPLSEAFWAAYAEPIDEFVEVAALFSDTLLGLDDDLGQGEQALDFVGRQFAAGRAFYSLVAGVHPALVSSDDGYVRAWRTKSLLSSFAMMVYLDLTNGKRVIRCEVCDKPFVSGAYQARYCSDRCRNTALKRAYRQRQKEAVSQGKDEVKEASSSGQTR